MNQDTPFEESNWVLYKDRPSWRDIEPLSQNDGSSAIVQIAYSEKFRDVFDYFRAVLFKDEKSERSFKLTEDAISLNPSNYTVWYFRRVLLQALKKDLHKELIYVQSIIEDNPKNYQVWHHRQVIVDWLRDTSEEKQLTEAVLKVDPKNYHAWQHRQWVLEEFGIWEGEIEFVEQLLEDDIRNNSAWNHRWFCISRTSSGELMEDVLMKELNILEERGLTKYPFIWEFCEELYSEGCRSPYLLAFMVDYLEAKGEESSDNLLSVQRAIEICNALAIQHDKIRAEYWKFMARNLGKKYEASPNCSD
ncbi:protein farnesyltransferase/geranylgeranyltransferase type-1 subunit alpha-like isoform X2 [Limulus polyphemus]|uniref:Protein farnesyltransferase/geranylgeranyltransferase type-1 subunit alpha n=1 Tax=Limulus polyphemus TaxID=6850 RepID=A0ABM1T830_LIMPO|nr:protein farnesyltransferase/geranylgeranyltransferase type-1 subunit alpha-like isoform X2 [Limulus polyphemus]